MKYKENNLITLFETEALYGLVSEYTQLEMETRNNYSLTFLYILSNRLCSSKIYIKLDLGSGWKVTSKN